MQPLLQSLARSPCIPEDSPCWLFWAVRDPYPVGPRRIRVGGGPVVGRFTASAREGLSAEARFALAAKRNLPRERYPMVESVDAATDMRDHIDAYVSVLRDVDDDDSLARYYCSVDVKAPKRVRRSDPRPSSEIMWVETKNVRGKPGWVHGKADLIAQEIEGRGFLVLSRPALARFAEAHALRDPDCCHTRPDRPLEKVLKIPIGLCAEKAGVSFWRY